MFIHIQKVFVTNLHAFTWQSEVDLGVEPVSIEVGHPIVSAIGNFAVKAFNMACEMVWFPSNSFELLSLPVFYKI